MLELDCRNTHCLARVLPCIWAVSRYSRSYRSRLNAGGYPRARSCLQRTLIVSALAPIGIRELTDLNNANTADDAEGYRTSELATSLSVGYPQ